MIPPLPKKIAVASSADIQPKLRFARGAKSSSPLFRLFALAMAGAALIHGATAQVIFSDDFESGNLNNWTSTAVTPSPLDIATPNNVVPVGGAFSAYMNTSTDRMHRNIIADNGGTELSGHSVATWYIYDAGGTASRIFNEVRGYSAGTGLPNGGTAANGALAQLLAAGKYNSVTLPAEVFDGTKYQARVTFGASAGWFNLNAAGAPSRSIGWHKFSIERMADGTTINFYVDGKLGRTIAGATADSWDTIILGPGLGTTVGDAWIDGFGVMTGVPVISTQPQSQTVASGGSVTFTVADAGGITYQWKRNGTDITDATASSYTINNLTSADNGAYSVVVGNSAGSTTSSEATLAVVTAITQQPANQTNCVGTSAAFSVTAVGEAPLSYQWYLNTATALPDETNATLSLANVQLSQAGNYTVVVTNNSGSVTSVVAVLVVNANPSVTVNSETICTGGMANLTAATATANPTYLWSPGGSTASSITVSPASTTIYTVTVTDSDTGCSATGSGTVTVNPLPTVAVNSGAICAGGSATLTATTSAANPSYLWSPGGAITPSIMVSPTETTVYSVIVTDGVTTCANSGSGTVTVTPVPTVAVNSVTVCAGSPATLTATTSAANPSYLWTPGDATTASITVSPTETTVYSVSVTDGAAPCPNSASGTVTVTPVAPVTVNSATICAGASATLTATTTAASPSYLWSPGGATTDSITVSPEMTTNYTVTVTDGATACVSSGSGTVTVNPLPTLTVNSVGICPGGSATLTAVTAAATPTYLWSPGGETTASITVSPASTTIYSVTVTDGTTTCTNTASGTVTVNPAPTVAVNSETICAGNSTTLTATTTATTPTYLWSPGGETTASITVSPASTTTYMVTVTDGSPDCVNSASGTVTVNPLPAVTVNSETICAGGSASLLATTGAANPTYLWSPGGETTASIMVTPGSTTVYTVTVTDGTTTCSASGSGTVTVNPLPTVTVNSPTICLGDSAVLAATTSAGSPTYLWSPGGETTASITVTPGSSATYSVTVTDGSTGCASGGSGLVTVKLPQSFANASPISINDNGAASPYPALINVSGLTATVCKVTVTLNSLNHDFPDDIDMVLVGPNGEGVLLMSDVGGGNGVSGATLTFDDAATASLPDAGQIVSGVFKPTNIGAKSDGLNDLFPAPAPAIRYTTNLASFAGIDPNGNWSLYILDDEAIDAGSIAGGWSIALTTLTPFADLSVVQATIPNPVAVGSNLTYTVTVTNLGPAAASDVVLTDTLPSGVTFVSATTPAGSCSELAGVVSCSFASINAGESAIVTIVVVPTGAETLVNQASVTSATLDFVAGNNSASASVVVLDPPVITVQPLSQTLCPGGTLSFMVTATGATPLSYQWYKNDVAIDGATSAAYSIVNAQPGDSGNYTVGVNNAVGSTLSTVAVGTVNPNPIVTVNSETICLGGSATLTATHNAANPIYLWSPGGATTASITVTPGSTTIYTVTVTDGVTTCFSGGSGTVTVNPLTVASALQSFSDVCPGGSVTFSTTASGTPPLSYVWRKSGTEIIGATGDSFTIAAVAAADAGTYTVEVTGGCSSVTNGGTLTVVAPPTITAQPQNQNSPMGNGVVFGVTATGVAPLTYQWQLNGTAIDGATASSLAVSNLTLAQSGGAYSVIVSNCAGPVTSATAVLTVTPVSGISFDFNTPGQYTNAPYYLTYNNWINGGFLPSPLITPTAYEFPIGGVGSFPGSGSLDLAVNNGNESTSILLPVSFDFSLPGKTLYASTMFKLKNPVSNSRSTQMGFVTSTNLGINDVAGQGFLTMILQSTAQPAPTYNIRMQRRLSGGGLHESTVLGASATLTVSNWYQFRVKFENTKGTGTASSNFTVSAWLQDMGPLGTTPGATNLSVVDANSASGTNFFADITNFKNVFLAIRGFENTGVDFRDNTYAWTTPGEISFVQPPQNQTVIQGNRAAFRAYVDGEGPYTYVWQRGDGSGGFTNIPLAGSWNYITPPARTSDHGAQIRVVVTGPANTLTSDPVTLTVTPQQLAVVSAGSVDGTTVGVLFNQPVDPATAENVANYSIGGAAPAQARVYRTSLGPLGPEGIHVVLTPTTILSGAFTVTVSGVQDLSGGAVGAANSAAGSVAGLTGFDVNPAITGPPGENYSFGPGQFIVTGGGADIFSGGDGFRYVYTTRTGDFDVALKIPYMDTVRFTGKAGIDARVSLDPFSPGAFAGFDPGPMAEGSGTLRQFTEGTAKLTWGAGGTSWGTGTRLFPPDVWVRFRRSGNTFLRYQSVNGVNWVFDGQISPPAFPPTVYLGLAVCSARNLYAASAQFENYGEFAGYPGSIITIDTQPTNITVNAGSAATIGGLTATVSGGGVPAAGERSFVWQRSDGLDGWTNMPTAGATNHLLAVGTVFDSDNGAQYRAIVTAPGALSVTSSVATLTVTDTALPTLSSANAAILPSYPVSEVLLTFSEPMSAATATDPANYTVTNAAGVKLTVLSATFLSGDPRTIVLKVDGQLGAGNATVGISGVRDLNDNVIANTVRTYRSFHPATAPVVIEVYQDIGNVATPITALTTHALFTAGTPTWIVYSNLFGFNVVNGFASSQDNYGVKAYSYFVAPSNGLYKFWIRSDDAMQLWINTNGIDPAGKVLICENTAANGNYTVGTAPGTSITNISFTAGQTVYMEALLKEGTGGDGFSVTWTAPTVNTAPGTGAFIPTANLAYPTGAAPSTPVVMELYTGYQNFLAGFNQMAGLTQATNFPTGTYALDVVNFKYIAGLPDVIAHQKYFGVQPGTLGNTRFDNYLGRLQSYFIAPSNGLYRFWMAVDDVAQLYMNTNAVNSTDPAGMVRLGQSANAFVSTASQLIAQNVPLVGGQKYYLMALWREGGGGDGVRVAVRSQGDTAIPPLTEVIPASMLEYPLAIGRAGVVKVMAIAPVNPTVRDGQSLTLSAAGISGAVPYGGFMWFKDGVKVRENSFTNMTPPLTMADNGAVYTVVVTNAFSRAESSVTVTVLPDGTAPTVVRTTGRRYNDGFTIVFSEPVEQVSATYLGNYQISGGVALLGAVLDATRTMLSMTTTPQAMDTTYTVTINGVRDASSSGNTIAANTMTTFSTWSIGGSGFLVELFTNNAGSSIADLTGLPKFVANLPDVVYYTNVFGAGLFAGNSGLENYGARVSGYFIPASTGFYRFYVRSDDSSQLWMNINSTDSQNPAGRIMLVHNINANLNINDPKSMSVPLPLNQGQSYYIEALMKEGGGGDYIQVTFRQTDENGTSLTAVPVDNSVLENSTIASFGGAGVPGNPDAIQILQTPPSDVFTVENDPVSLSLIASIPANIIRATSFQWQRFDGSTFTNIPGATTATFNFFAALADDNVQYRLVFSAPGRNANYLTTLHVTRDVTPPRIVAASSLDGNQIGICYNERIFVNTAIDTFNYTVNGGLNSVLNAEFRPDNKSVVLTIDPPVSGTFTVDVTGIWDLAEIVNEGASGTNGIVQGYVPLDVGSPAGPGSSFSCIPGEIDVIAGGNDIWGASDVGHLTLTPRSGDFDIHLRVHSLSRATADNDGITKAGLMVRESFDPASRKLHVLVEPPALVGGREFHEAGQRPTTGAATAAWAGGGTTGTGPAGIPNAWIRIKRSGDVFSAFRSVNGVDWSLTTTQSMFFSNPVLVGLATTAHIPVPSAATTLAEYRDIYIPNPPTILVQPAPVVQSVPLHGTATYSVTASNPPNSGALIYQWRKNGAAIAGANTDTLTLNNLSVADSGVYTVGVGNDGGVTTSVPVTLTVANQLPVVVGETLNTAQNVAVDVTAAVLLGNDSDPDGDAVSLLAVSGIYPVTFSANFDDGQVPAGTAIFGIAQVAPGGTGAGNAMHLTDNPAGSAFGVYHIPDLAGGTNVNQLFMRWRSRIGGATAGGFQFGRLGADGYSLTWGNDLPAVPAYNAPGEEGIGTNLVVSFDTWDAGGAEAPGLEIKWRGARVAFDNINPDQGLAKDFLRKDQFVDVQLTVDAAGLATLTYDGRTISASLAGWAGITGGGFMFGARTGGAVDNHWIDDVSIIELTKQTARGGQVVLAANGTITYTPASDTCGVDNYYYLVGDGQIGSFTVGQVAVNIAEATPTPPVIVTCPTNRTLNATLNCQAAIPDLTGEVAATDNCSFVVTQVPAPGTLIGVGSTVVTFTVTDAALLTATCQATLTVQDGEAPVITCPANMTVPCTTGSGAVVNFAVTANDLCQGVIPVVSTPASGSTFPLGVTTVTNVAIDSAGNSNACTFTITVLDSPVPSLTIVLQGANVIISWPQTCTPYALEASLELGAAASWEAVTETVETVGTNFQVTVSAATGNKFYRLKKQP